MKIIVSYILIFICLLSCRLEKKANNNSHSNTGLIMVSEIEANSTCIDLKKTKFPRKEELFAYIQKDKEYMESDGVSTYFGSNYTDESISLIFPLVSHWLIKNGYKTPTEEKFYADIKSIFNLEPTSKSFANNKNEYLEYYLYNDGVIYNMIGDGSLIFIPEYKLIYRVPPLGELVTVDGEEEDQYYTCLPQRVLHYNKFIFNDSKASLTWLLNNDMEFLSLFVWKVGYDKNEKINEAVLNYIFRDYEMFDGYPVEYDKFDELFFTKDFDGKLSIRKDLLKSIEKITTQDNLKYIYFLNNYIFKFFTNSNQKAKYSTEELSEIFVNIAVIEERMRTAYFKPAAPEWNNRSNSYYLSIRYPELLETAEKYNYFDIPFEDVLEMFQWDGEPL